MVSNIWVAAADNEVSTVSDYLASGAFAADAKDPNGYTPLHAAASYGHRDLLKLLVQKGGDINVQDNEGDTPLHHTEDVETATMMVEQLGANPKLKNAEGQTAADFVEEEDEFPELARYLRSLSHDEVKEPSLLASLPVPGTVDGHQIRYTMEEDQGEMDEERRKKLEAIVNLENPEEALRDLVTAAVREGLAGYNQEGEEGPKRKR